MATWSPTFPSVPVAHSARPATYSTRLPSLCMFRLYWPFGEVIRSPAVIV
jgi:hypothetical protein